LSAVVESYRTLSNPRVDTQVLTHLLTHIDTLTSILSACERLLRTPIPLGYNIAISRIVWIFILTLPGQLWAELNWWSVAVTAVTAYALFALAEVGLEIENARSYALPSCSFLLCCRSPNNTLLIHLIAVGRRA